MPDNIVAKLLREIGVEKFKIDPKDWEHSLSLNFGSKEDSADVRNDIFAQMQEALNTQDVVLKRKGQQVMGLYAIYDKGICLYVGKGKHLYSRFYTHYLTSIGKEKVEKYREFFTKRPGEKTIYWTHIQFKMEHISVDEKKAKPEDVGIKLQKYKGETLRIVLERLVSCHMLTLDESPKQPVFEDEHASIK